MTAKDLTNEQLLECYKHCRDYETMERYVQANPKHEPKDICKACGCVLAEVQDFEACNVEEEIAERFELYTKAKAQTTREINEAIAQLNHVKSDLKWIVDKITDAKTLEWVKATN